MEHEPAAATADSPLAAARRARARAESAELRTMLGEYERECSFIDAEDRSRAWKQLARSAVVLEIAQASGRSELQVSTMLSAARRLRTHTPSVWQAFVAGELDWIRTRDIASAIDRLERAASYAWLDERAPGYGASHTASEVRSWLKRFIARAEPDESLTRAEANHAERQVTIVHSRHDTDDGMSWVNAYLPSHQAAAIDAALDQTARAHRDPERTLAQQRADIFTTSLLAESGSTARIATDIAVVVDADTLSGQRDAFAVSVDGHWGVPLAWILADADEARTVWHRIVTEPGHDTLTEFKSAGRFATGTLATAIAVRDGVCRVPGCAVPARRCDIDHITPHPIGATTAANLQLLCRRHHRMKSHDLIDHHQPPAPLEHRFGRAAPPAVVA